MTTPSSPSLLSSQGQGFGISNAYKISIKSSRPSPSSSQLDASTLAIAHGGDRVYENGLFDPGPNGGTDGITVTASVSTWGDPPAKGDTKTFKGKLCKCTKSEIVNDSGKLREGMAEYTSDF
jgi:hypothetical protein